MVDRRILPDLRWIAAALPDLRHRRLLRARCPTANTSAATAATPSDSDHYNGLAVDLVPLDGEQPNATRSWAPITRLALWAEPVQNQPRRRPSAGSATTATPATAAATTSTSPGTTPPAPEFQLAEWVEVFPVGASRDGDHAAAAADAAAAAEAAAAEGPPGGISQVQTGGVVPRGAATDRAGVRAP